MGPYFRALLPFRPLWGDVAIAIACITLATLVAHGLVAIFGATRAGVVFLTAILLAGAFRGLWGSLFAALLATLSYNFFLMGRDFSFQILTGDEVHNLVLFSVAAVFTGGLAGRLKSSERSAIRRTTALATLLRIDQLAESSFSESVLMERATATVQASLPTLRLTASASSMTGTPGVETGANIRTGPIMLEGETVGHLVWTAGYAEYEEFVALLADRLAGFVAAMRARDLARRLQIERSRNLLLASVSHDFRSPLATIVAATSSLIDLDGEIDGKARLRLITAARDEAERLDRFVSHLLEAMRRAPDGVMTATVGIVDVRARLQVLADRFNAPALWLQVQVSGPACQIMADEMLFSQAFSNIIENAVKHSPVASSVQVRIRKLGRKVEVVVEDSGPGVPESDLADIFERYFQAAPEMKRSGYGIGLAVARFNLDAMGGEVRALNRPEGGLQIIVQFAAGKDGRGE